MALEHPEDLPRSTEADTGTPGSDRRGYRPTFAERVARRLRRDVPLVLLDLAIVVASYLGTLVLRFDGHVPSTYWHGFWRFAPTLLLVHLLTNYLFGLYGQMWRYASVQEARRVLLAGFTAGMAVSLIGSTLLGPLRPVPLSVMGLGAIMSLVGFGAIRFESRLFALRRRASLQERRRILVVGAGEAGVAVVRDLRRNPSLGLDAVGLVDDDPWKLGLSIHGANVLGRIWEIPALVAAHEVDEVLLAIPSATSGLVRDVADLCEQAQVVLRVLPSMREAVAGRVTARDIRDLRIEDLLGRQQVSTDLDAVARILRGRNILVTGAGGSIGSEIARQVLTFDPAALILLDHDETHLHDILTELGDGRVRGVLADVRDRSKMFALMLEHSPDAIFHAAAHKHVPVLEEYPEEALRTNVIGTANLADAASAAHVSQFVLISTDKAVRPASVMGASKWFAEQIIWSAGGNGCKYSAVRFGNVLGSRGSVIPTFLRQIQQGGPVTVTDPSMTRYFMSVQEAVQLVLQAAALSSGGEVFTLDMGEPVKILELAREVIRLSGRVPGKDIEIAITGTRPGEKLVEDIVNGDEDPIASGHSAIVAARPPLPDKRSLRRAIRSMEQMAEMGNGDELRQTIKILAEKTPQRMPEEIRL